jgi:LysR family cys regulon transcriptional activator
MKLQQLRYLREVSRSGLNVSQAAATLHTSQPGVSKQIRLLEQELGVDIFVRNGKRVVEITEAGRAILAIAERVLLEADNLKQTGREFSDDAAGSLIVATTHTQARYSLPRVIKNFIESYPKVRLILHQGNPIQVAEQVAMGKADIAIATEGLSLYADLVTLPCYRWNRVVVTPPDHPLQRESSLSLEALARFPLITYDYAFTGRSTMNRAFEARGLEPNVVLTALDSDVIKTYVELGLGVGILAHMAFDPEVDRSLRAIDASRLFESSTTRIGIRRGAFLRGYQYAFIRLFAPHLSRKTVDDAIGGKGTDYQL